MSSWFALAWGWHEGASHTSRALAQHQNTVCRMQPQQQIQLTTSTTPHRRRTHSSHYKRASNSNSTAADARAEVTTASCHRRVASARVEGVVCSMLCVCYLDPGCESFQTHAAIRNPRCSWSPIYKEKPNCTAKNNAKSTSFSPRSKAQAFFL